VRSYQASVRRNLKDGLNVKIRRWDTWSGRKQDPPKSGMLQSQSGFKRWGIIEELNNGKKLLLDFDNGGNHDVLCPKCSGVRARCPTRSRLRIHPNAVPCPPLASLVHTTGLSVQWVRWDRTRHGWHAVVKIRQKLKLAEVIACQAILGSDRDRERLNITRCLSLRLHPSAYWEKRANILYSRKVQL
jgi:hypothetical protein